MASCDEPGEPQIRSPEPRGAPKPHLQPPQHVQSVIDTVCTFKTPTVYQGSYCTSSRPAVPNGAAWGSLLCPIWCFGPKSCHASADPHRRAVYKQLSPRFRVQRTRFRSGTMNHSSNRAQQSIWDCRGNSKIGYENTLRSSKALSHLVRDP